MSGGGSVVKGRCLRTCRTKTRCSNLLDMEESQTEDGIIYLNVYGRSFVVFGRTVHQREHRRTRHGHTPRGYAPRITPRHMPGEGPHETGARYHQLTPPVLICRLVTQTSHRLPPHRHKTTTNAQKIIIVTQSLINLFFYIPLLVASVYLFSPHLSLVLDPTRFIPVICRLNSSRNLA